MNLHEPFPRPAPRMPLGNRERTDLIPVVVGAHLRQPPELEAGDLPRGLTISAAERVPAPQELLPYAWESDYGGAGVHPLSVELYAPALAAEPLRSLEQRYPMSGTPQQGRGREAPDAPADHDHALHGYIPSESAATSCTPATVPAT
jgi:hypothetical protein